jgi:hypothetical protein
MKNKYFYSSLVETTEISLELGEIELSPDERVHLISLVQANIHSVVIDTVLSSLPNEEKKVFLKNLVSQNHEKTWDHLKNNVSNIEEKIKSSIEEVKRQLQKDIKLARKTK